ncbi:MAG: hypothetical protein M1835_000371 [Candelina submexicana]|nr:MAG: hypothetical protein M1835_000371 [Candelina submexicana]
MNSNGSQMLTKAQVLRFSRSDAADDSFVLVQVTPDGPSLLDLKLIATEGENPFVGTEFVPSNIQTNSERKVRQNRLHKLRAKNYDGNGDDWEMLVAKALHRDEANAGQSKAGLEVVSSVSGGQLTITIRKNIGGITDDEQAIELFDWTGIATSATASAEDKLAALTSRYQDQETIISKLSKQLEDLIKTKQEHENALLEKFRELLNAKKRKIRDQQRLLADAKVNPKTGSLWAFLYNTLLATYFTIAKRIQEARGSSELRKPAQSRQGKRKANGAGIDEDMESEVDGFEDMDVTGRGREEMIDELGREETPDKSDLDETEDEAEDNPISPSSSRQVESGLGAKGKAIETVKQQEPTSKPPESTTPPPRRELPFAKKKQGQTAPKEQSLPTNDNKEESDEETDDDEL